MDLTCKRNHLGDYLRFRRQSYSKVRTENGRTGEVKAELKGPREEQNDATEQLNLRRGIGSLWEMIQYAQTREQRYLPSVAVSWVVRPQLGELPCWLKPFLTLPGKYSLFPSFSHLVPALKILPSQQSPGYMPLPPLYTVTTQWTVFISSSCMGHLPTPHSVYLCHSIYYKQVKKASPNSPNGWASPLSWTLGPSLGPKITEVCVYTGPTLSAECLAKAWWKAVNGN